MFYNLCQKITTNAKLMTTDDKFPTEILTFHTESHEKLESVTENKEKRRDNIKSSVYTQEVESCSHNYQQNQYPEVLVSRPGHFAYPSRDICVHSSVRLENRTI